MQVEIDYKSECMAGQTVESLGSRVVEDTNGTGFLRCGPGDVQKLHRSGQLSAARVPCPCPHPCTAGLHARPSLASPSAATAFQHSAGAMDGPTAHGVLCVRAALPDARMLPGRRYVHLLRRCDERGCYELVRARTTWKPTYPKL